MHDGAVVRRAARHADRARALAGRGFHYAHEALPANVDRVQRVRVRAFRRGRLMAEMPEGVPDAIRAGRSVRNALLGWRRVASDEDDPGLVDLGLRQRGLRDALRVHHDRVVGAVHDNGLVAGRDRARATQMVDLAVPRFAGCVAGLGSGDGGTPPYVTVVARLTPELAFVQTATVTPEAVPPGVCVHEKDASLAEAGETDAPMWATAISRSNRTRAAQSGECQRRTETRCWMSRTTARRKCWRWPRIRPP
jgi:hypothetical protein